MGVHPSLRRFAVGLVVAIGLSVVTLACAGGDAAPAVATVSVTPSKARVAIGGPVDFSYRFEVASDAVIDGDYQVFVHAIDADGRLLWTDDHMPPVPTSAWAPGDVVAYTRTRFVPRLASAGEVSVVVGLYRGDLRLPLAGGAGGGAAADGREYHVADVQLLPESEGIFLIYAGGWYPDEFDESDPASTWRWTGPEAVLAFANPTADATLYLEYDARAEVFGDAPQTITVFAGETVVDVFEAAATGTELRRIDLPATALGADEMAEVRLRVDRAFVPAALPAGGLDERELGIRVYHLFVERR